MIKRTEKERMKLKRTTEKLRRKIEEMVPRKFLK